MTKNRGDAMEFLNQFFPDKLTTGRVIQAKRKNFGITLDEVSQITGIDIGNLSAIENDKKQIGVKTATKIGFAVGLHPSTILFPDGYETGDPELEVMKEKGEELLEKKIPLKKMVG